MCYIAYTYLPFILGIILVAIIASLSLALAFYKINNKPFIDILEAAFMFYTTNNLYIWKKGNKPIVKEEEVEKEQAQVFVPRLSDSKLKELSWTLDINENLNPLTGEDGKTTK
jgi:ABC-type glucose/galactose transport system permease subunit